MDEPLTLQQLRKKAKLSKPKLAHLAGLDYRTVTRAELVNSPVFEMTAVKILAALQRHFERYPEWARGIVVPETIEQIAGLVIYQAMLHKGSPARIPPSEEEQTKREQLIARFAGGKPASEMAIEDRGPY